MFDKKRQKFLKYNILILELIIKLILDNFIDKVATFTKTLALQFVVDSVAMISIYFALVLTSLLQITLSSHFTMVNI